MNRVRYWKSNQFQTVAECREFFEYMQHPFREWLTNIKPWHPGIVWFDWRYAHTLKGRWMR